MTIFVSCRSTKSINNIKFNPVVWNVVGQQGTYLKVDMLETAQTSCPGYILMVHPKLTWNEDLINNIKECMANVKVDTKNTVVDKWLESYDIAPREDETNHVSYFLLNQKTSKMKGSEAEVRNIVCAKKDAEYLKLFFPGSVRKVTK